MNILILNPNLYTFGGGEKYMGFFCQAIEKMYLNVKIDILIYDFNGIKADSYCKDALTILNSKFDLSLKNTNLIKLDNIRESSFWERYKLRKKIHRLSKKYDLFINWNFLSKQVGNAKKNIYFCMFPPKKYEYNSWSLIRNIRKRECDKIFIKGYDSYLVISEYTSLWTKKYWPEIKDRYLIYPPVLNEERTSEVIKKKIILCVGRFFMAGHNKKQDIILKMFIDNQKVFGDYELHMVGSVSSELEDIDYFNDLKSKSEKYDNVIIHNNMKYEELILLYEEARFFWHATGYGIDEEDFPDKMEHFGITTVEAMHFGVVPIVINKGGQVEIVDDNINGYTWGSIEECVDKTSYLIKNPIECEKFSCRAKKKADMFSVNNFENTVRGYMNVLLGET